MIHLAVLTTHCNNKMLTFTEVLLLDLLEDSAAYILLVYYATFFVWKKIPRQRNPSIFAQRLYWEEYCAAHVERNTFSRRLRM